MGKMKELMDSKQEQILSEVNRMVETEMELFEFNLFISSIGKKKLERADKEVKELRKKVKTGKIILEKIDKIAEGF